MSENKLKMDASALREFMTSAFERELTWVIDYVGMDGITVRQPVGSGDLRPGGTVSGPTLMALADGVAYMALLSQIGPAALAVTSNLNINFLRRPRPTDLVSKGRLLKLGRSLALVEVSMYSALEPAAGDLGSGGADGPGDREGAGNGHGDREGAGAGAGDRASATDRDDFVIDDNAPLAHATVTYSLALLGDTR
ncbi:MAG: PaaI family thioesterase [Microthrixaceae bacterium]